MEGTGRDGSGYAAQETLRLYLDSLTCMRVNQLTVIQRDCQHTGILEG